MHKRFEYQVCRVNFGRVTFVNDVWQGANVPETERKEEHALSCLPIYEYLQRAGADGWELVSALDSFFWSVPSKGARGPSQQVPYQFLFLKRELA